MFQTGLNLLTSSSGIPKTVDDKQPINEVRFHIGTSLFSFPSLFALFTFLFLNWIFKFEGVNDGKLVLQLNTLQVEVGRLHDENKKLKSLLDHITKSYKDLQAQLLVAMRKQAHGNREEQVNLV